VEGARRISTQSETPAATASVNTVAQPETPSTNAPSPESKPEPKPEPTPETKPVVRAKPSAPAEPDRFIRKRRDTGTAEELRKQLVAMTEINISVPPDSSSGRVIVAGRDIAQASSDPVENLSRFFTRLKLKEAAPHQAPVVLAQHAPLLGLPFRMGDDCQLGKEPAETMQATARTMRGILSDSMKNNRLDPRMDPETIRERIRGIYDKMESHKENAIPCLMQMLQPENAEVRLVMLEQLTSIKHRQSSEALARLALYDLSDRVREKAVEALATRPRDEYRHLLLAGFSYPWPPIADHAAEALVALNDGGAVPFLERLATTPDPTKPHFDPASKGYVVSDVVRLNHLTNCMLCHAVSNSPADLVRGRVPAPDKELPPLTQYYEDTNGIFVRADATYLKQDFSVYQPVANPGRWPQMQRYDYVVRRRPLPASEYQQRRDDGRASFPQREAVLFALRELKP
jgi:hypothetical protein